MSKPPEDLQLVVLGASKQLAAVARQLGCRLIHVQKPGSRLAAFIEPNPVRSTLYTVDYTAAALLGFVEQVLRPLQPDAVVSIREDGLIPAALANEHLGLVGTPLEVVETLRDKASMRALLELKAPHLTLRASVPASTAEAVAIFLGWGGGPAILKPRSGAGSQGVVLIESVDDLRAQGDPSGRLLEEYLPGQEYSAESFSVGGVHRIFAIVEKHIGPSFVELAHVVPAPSLDIASAPAVQGQLVEFLDVVGLVDGPAHTEFKLTGDGLKIIESHSRVGGDGIPHLVHLVTGTDLLRWSLGWPLGLGAPAPGASPAAGAAAIAFATAPEGVVESVVLPSLTFPDATAEEVRSFVKPGDSVAALTSSSARVGSGSASGADASCVLAAARALAEGIRIVTRPAGESI
ncbi:ATP-grasp domain-containing protein [Streptomyces sp. SID13031]|uniref:ATP-grasp domain-containing protein n=1 Tax=Streptomyces sp. SID13031 TaxID=2706046 RepID=UPI0013C5B5B7|nr:ATP-grasp domain-containing protein [Streptomyces sp. SID13031]NEA33577.1 ATP-grasp domain-containing protein [Streptomyces sp. SID13031]